MVRFYVTLLLVCSFSGCAMPKRAGQVDRTVVRVEIEGIAVRECNLERKMVEGVNVELLSGKGDVITEVQSDQNGRFVLLSRMRSYLTPHLLLRVGQRETRLTLDERMRARVQLSYVCSPDEPDQSVLAGVSVGSTTVPQGTLSPFQNCHNPDFCRDRQLPTPQTRR